jgi:hypothetical protein
MTKRLLLLLSLLAMALLAGCVHWPGIDNHRKPYEALTPYPYETLTPYPL